MADILFVCATHLEAAPFLEHYPGKSRDIGRSGLSVISGKIGMLGGSEKQTYDLLVTGPGVFNTAHALTVYFENADPEYTHPDLVIQAGIAGVFKETGLGIGDFVFATRTQYIHTGLETGAVRKAPLLFDLIEGVPASREGVYPFDYALVSKMCRIIGKEAANREINIGKGLILTVSTITSTNDRAVEIYEAFSPLMEAMEGAASAHVAAMYGTPMIELRAASNFAGEDDRSKWDIDTAVKNLGWAMGELRARIL